MLGKRKEEALGRKLSHMLRHDPGSWGVSMDEKGQVSVEEVLKALSITEEEFLEIVGLDSKGRFVVSGSSVFAAQGHSIPVELEFEKVSSTEPLFHGTKAAVLEKILEEGLKPQSRQWVHLSGDMATAKNVAARREGDSVILEVDVEGLQKSGVQVFKSRNGVFLAKAVPGKFLSPVEASGF